MPETLRGSWDRTWSELAHMAAKDVQLLRILRSFTGHSRRCCVSLWVEQVVPRRVSQVMRYNFSAGVSGVIQSPPTNRSRDPAHPNLSVCNSSRTQCPISQKPITTEAKPPTTSSANPKRPTIEIRFTFRVPNRPEWRASPALTKLNRIKNKGVPYRLISTDSVAPKRTFRDRRKRPRVHRQDTASSGN